MKAAPRMAFTLVEMMVVIGAVGLLVALTLPALAGARGSAGEARALANLRSTSLTLADYSQIHRDSYPWAPAGTAFLLAPPGDPPVYVQAGYWELHLYWPSLMHEVAPWRDHFRAWVDLGVTWDGDGPWNRIPNGTPSYQMSDTFFARPELWMLGTRETAALYSPVRTNDVLYPSSKVVLFDWELGYVKNRREANQDLRPMLFVDGHARLHRISDATPAQLVPFKQNTLPVQDTPGGVRGRDYP